MDDENKNNFEELNIFNCIKLKYYLGEELSKNSNNINNNESSLNLPNDDKVFILGKMNEHSLQAKYSFKACEFLIFIPSINKLFHTEMDSLNCFTNTLKWNQNFFKKIRLCLESQEGIKNTYFAINYEKSGKEEKEKNDDYNYNEIIIIDYKNQNNILNSNFNNTSDEEEIEVQFSEKKIYLELHFVVENKDIIALRLLLNHILEDKPNFTFLNKLLEMDKTESDRIVKKQEKLYDKDKEIIRMETEINQEEKNLEKRKKQYLYKFYYLNKEKNIKIVELNNQIKKEKKLYV